jgi:hypothetical protein
VTGTTRIQAEGENVPPIVVGPGTVIIVADREQALDVVSALHARAEGLELGGSESLGTQMRVRRLRAFAADRRRPPRRPGGRPVRAPASFWILIAISIVASAAGALFGALARPATPASAAATGGFLAIALAALIGAVAIFRAWKRYL